MTRLVKTDPPVQQGGRNRDLRRLCSKLCCATAALSADYRPFNIKNPKDVEDLDTMLREAVELWESIKP